MADFGTRGAGSASVLVLVNASLSSLGSIFLSSCGRTEIDGARWRNSGEKWYHSEIKHLQQLLFSRLRVNIPDFKTVWEEQALLSSLPNLLIHEGCRLNSGAVDSADWMTYLQISIILFVSTKNACFGHCSCDCLVSGPYKAFSLPEERNCSLFQAPSKQLPALQPLLTIWPQFWCPDTHIWYLKAFDVSVTCTGVTSSKICQFWQTRKV